jgi:hypothetical protein
MAKAGSKESAFFLAFLKGGPAHRPSSLEVASWLRGLRQWLPGLYGSTQAQPGTTLFALVPVLVSVVALFSFLEFRSHGGAA